MSKFLDDFFWTVLTVKTDGSGLQDYSSADLPPEIKSESIPVGQYIQPIMDDERMLALSYSVNSPQFTDFPEHEGWLLEMREDGTIALNEAGTRIMNLDDIDDPFEGDFSQQWFTFYYTNFAWQIVRSRT
jgi:hypothetical protein